jgi:hypothetical protein
MQRQAKEIEKFHSGQKETASGMNCLGRKTVERQTKTEALYVIGLGVH